MMKHTLSLFFMFFILINLFANETEASITYYGEVGCSHCDLFEKKILPGIEQETGVNVELKAFDILNSKYYEKCSNALKEMGLDFTIFPVLFIGNNAYLGNSALETGLHDELVYFKKHHEFRPFNKYLSHSPGRITTGVVPVFFAGLVDGINPCAFATLVFFISFLSMQGRTKREILVTGILFTLSVFCAYFLLGLGLLNTFRLIIDISLVKFIMKCIVSGVTLIFLVLSIRDFYLVRIGRVKDVTLQLPMVLKKRLHKVIRHHNGGPFFIGGVILTGLTVSVIELACTGQVYLPTIAYMIQTDDSLLGLRSLLIYNIGFILPLIFVFGAVYFGISSATFSRLLVSKMHYSKLMLSAVFLFLAVIIWIV